MRPDLETLRAFADGELSPTRRAEVEAALASDAQAAADAQAMFASRLPYRSAFEHDGAPPVPAALQVRVAELASVAAAAEQLAWAGSVGGRASTPMRPVLRWMLLMLLPLLGVALGYAVGVGGAAKGPVTEPWLRSVAVYHAMYSRDTVTDGGTGTGAAQAQLQTLQALLREQQGVELTVPDFSAQGLQFVRAQRLVFEGQTVVQLVYLPRQGEPVALCLMAAPNQPERVLMLEGQHAFAWQARGWAHVLIGSLPLEQMRVLRSQVSQALI